jgi:SAM-dependent methyltransferase
MTHSTPDPKSRFSSRVDAYVAARPRYPREIIDHLRRAIGLAPQWTIADVGSGTGISCELFLANGNPVFTVEPNAPMRFAAETSLRQFSNFHSVDGSAEATTLPDASVDLVVAAQAFHWFNRPVARAEFQRILRPNGWVLLMWNDRKLGGKPFLEAYETLMLDYGTDYLKVRHNNIAETGLEAFFAGPYRTAVFANDQRLDLAGLMSRVLSSSYTPPPENPTHAAMLDRVRSMFEQHNENGVVTIEYQTELFYGRLPYNS